MIAFATVLALSLQLLAPYLIWPSRWNIPAHIAAGFCITAYIIPGLLTDPWSQYPADTVSLFTRINLFGAAALCAGIIMGGRLSARPPSQSLSMIPPWTRTSSARLVQRVIVVGTVCVIGMYLAYYIMGFIPMFADDPFSAKQFKGIYRDMYYRAAYLFRFSFSVLAAAMPLILILAWYKRSKYMLLLASLAFFAILISLARGAMATGLLIFLGIIAARSRVGMRWYIPLVLIVFPFGSVFYYVLGQVLDVQQLRSGYLGESFSDFISSGAPDILDQLDWLHGFKSGDYFSWGRTIYGGLIPGNYQWNPSVWTLTYNNLGGDISDTVSGGLRLTAAEWGYANFSWLGVLLIPFLSGLFNGLMIRRLKTWLPQMGVLPMTTTLLVYATLGQQIVQFYLLSIHNIPAIAAALYFWRANAVAARPVVARHPGRLPARPPVAGRALPGARDG
jgi:hypothetical protein